MFGNGLGKLVWARFMERFGDCVDKIVEVYGATEGATGNINALGKVGSFGFIPQTIPFSPMSVLKIDDEGNFLVMHDLF